MDTLPKKPATTRIVMRSGRFLLKAVGNCNSVKAVKQVKYNGFLPKVSERGARIRGPIPSIMTNPVWQAITLFRGTFRDSAIWSIPGVNMLLASGVMTDIS